MILSLILTSLLVPAAASSVISSECEDLLIRENLYELYVQSMEENRSVSDRRLSKNLFLEAKRFLRKNKVKFDDVIDHGSLALRISPGDGHPLSRLASRLMNSHAAELIYSPATLVMNFVEGAGGYRENEDGSPILALFIGTEWLLDHDRYSRHAGILHEIWHLKNFGMKQQGTSKAYQSNIYADEGIIPHDLKVGNLIGYDEFLSLEELEAFRITVYAETMKLLRMLREESVAEEDLAFQIDNVVVRGKQWKVISRQVALFIKGLEEAHEGKKINFSFTETDMYIGAVLWNVEVMGNLLGIEMEFPEVQSNEQVTDDMLNQRLEEIEVISDAFEIRTAEILPLFTELSRKISNVKRIDLAKQILKKLAKVQKTGR